MAHITCLGNYQLIERPGMRQPPGIYRPPAESDKQEEEIEPQPEEEEPPVPVEPPKPETPWERGLRHAKEVSFLLCTEPYV